jgi:hypothetical protein
MTTSPGCGSSPAIRDGRIWGGENVNSNDPREQGTHDGGRAGPAHEVEGDDVVHGGVAVDGEALRWIRGHLAGDRRLMRRLIKLFAEQLMAAEVDRLCRAGPADSGGPRVNRRNGYRAWVFDTDAGPIPLRVPKVRQGGYVPTWLSPRPKAAEQALTDAACRAYVEGVTSQAIADVVTAVGMVRISPPQLAAIAGAVNAAISDERRRPLENGLYPELWLHAHTQTSNRRIRNMTTRIGTADNAEGDREVLGLAMTVIDDERSWRLLLRGLVRRGLSGVAVVKGEARSAGLARAVAAELPGAVCAPRPADDRSDGTGAAPTSEASEWAPAPTAADDGRLADRSAPQIVLRRHGWGGRADLAPSIHPPAGDATRAGGHDVDSERARRARPIVAAVAVVALMAAVAIGIWRDSFRWGHDVTPSTPVPGAVSVTVEPAASPTIPTTTSAVAPQSGSPATAPAVPTPSVPSTVAGCTTPASPYADLSEGGVRRPWMSQVQCAAIAQASRD